MLGLLPMAVSLPQKATSTFICSGGELVAVASIIAKATEISLISSEIKQPGIDSWVIDTGSGRHLVSRKVLDTSVNIKQLTGYPGHLLDVVIGVEDFSRSYVTS